MLWIVRTKDLNLLRWDLLDMHGRMALVTSGFRWSITLSCVSQECVGASGGLSQNYPKPPFDACYQKRPYLDVDVAQTWRHGDGMRQCDSVHI